MSVSRRGFLKFGLGAALAGAVSGLGFNLRPAFAQAKEFKLKWTKQTTSICCYCAVGCGLHRQHQHRSDNPLGQGHAPSTSKAIRIIPINEGSLCRQGRVHVAAYRPITISAPRSRFTAPPTPPNGKKWNGSWALAEIAKRVKASRDKPPSRRKNDRPARWSTAPRPWPRWVPPLWTTRSAGPYQAMQRSPGPGVYRAPGASLTQRHCHGSGRVVRTRCNDESLERFGEQ